MGLSCGIVGLPNVGKSSLFNGLVGSLKAESQNYPFTTIEPNHGIVEVPNFRLHELAKIVQTQKIIPATLEFVDIAGLVQGASKGEGLGNQFLSHIREVNVILQIVRLFEDHNIVHVHGYVNPVEDVETIFTELMLKDIDTVENRIKKTKHDKSSLEILNHILHLLHSNQFLYTQLEEQILDSILVQELNLLTTKPMVLGINISENMIGKEDTFEQYQALQKIAQNLNIIAIPFCVKIETEILMFPQQEKQEMLEAYGIQQTGIETIITHIYRLLNLISFFTAGEKEVKAWTIKNGTLAPQAAGTIHKDFEKKFIKAEVISYKDFISCQGYKQAQETGKLRIEGKTYQIQDGDVIHFRSNA